MKIEPFDLPGGRGKRLVVVNGGAETLKLEAPTNSKPPGVTIYWRGRVNLQKLVAFFAEGCPNTPSHKFGSVVFFENERIRINGFGNLWDLEREIPQNAGFVRLEHADAASDAPDFIVWSRVDLEDVAPEHPAPDYIGVSALRERLDTLREMLASFVANTHVNHIPRQTALDSVRRVLHYPAQP